MTPPRRHASLLPRLLLAAAASAPAARADAPSPAAAALQAALDAAIAAGAPTFALPPGNTFFNGANFNISGAGAMSIGGADGAAPTTLFFEPGFGVAVSDAHGTELRGFSIDYAPLPFVFGPVRAGGNSSGFVLDLDAQSLAFEELVALYPPHDTWPGAGFFRDGELLSAACRWGRPTPATPIAGSPRAYSVRCNGAATAAGDVFVAATRVGITLSLSRCAAVAVRDVNVLAAGYMAVTEFQGDGGNVYERVRIAPPSASRPLGSNADGFHSSGAAVGPKLLNTTIRNLFDDFFNVHTTAQLFIGPSSKGAASFLVGDFQLFPGGNTNYGTQTTLDRVQPGQDLSFFPLNTFSYPALATARIASIERVEGAAADALLASAYANASALAHATPCSACEAGLNKYALAQLWNVTFEDASPLVTVPSLSFATADAISAAGAVVADCTFANSISNLGRWKSSNSRIERTSWARTSDENLEIEPLQNWLEGPFGIHNVTIDSCVFGGTSTSPVHTFGAVDVVQTNNSYIPSP
jgi:hypothetical protein